MTPKDHEKAKHLIWGMGRIVSPKPEEGQDSPRVTIEVPTWPAQDRVFEALGGLLLKDIEEFEEQKKQGGVEGPVLSLHSRRVDNGRVLLEFDDLAAQDSN